MTFGKTGPDVRGTGGGVVGGHGALWVHIDPLHHTRGGQRVEGHSTILHTIKVIKKSDQGIKKILYSY